MSNKSTETWVPLSRGIVAHLPKLKGSLLQVYIYLLCEATASGEDKGIYKRKIKDISIDLEIDYKTLHIAINKLKDRYIEVKPAKNQHELTEFKILKYKTVKDYSREQQPVLPQATPEAPPQATGRADREQQGEQIESNRESTVGNTNNDNDLQNAKKLRSKEVKKGEELKKNINNIFIHWNGKKIIKHRNKKIFEPTIKSKLKDYSEQEIIEAISNYSEILNSSEYWFTHKWTLKEFLQRGLDKFLTENNPFENYKREINGTNKQNNKPKEPKRESYVPAHFIRPKDK